MPTNLSVQHCQNYLSSPCSGLLTPNDLLQIKARPYTTPVSLWWEGKGWHTRASIKEIKLDHRQLQGHARALSEEPDSESDVKEVTNKVNTLIEHTFKVKWRALKQEALIQLPLARSPLPINVWNKYNKSHSLIQAIKLFIQGFGIIRNTTDKDLCVPFNLKERMQEFQKSLLPHKDLLTKIDEKAKVLIKVIEAIPTSEEEEPASQAEIFKLIDENSDKITALIEKDRSVLNLRWKGMQPLTYAIQQKKSSLAKAILTQKPNLHLRDTNGYSALHWAIFAKDKDLVESLIEEKHPLNLLEKNGNTAFHLAIKEELDDIAQLLLSQKEIDFKKADLKGITPLETAFEKANLPLIKAILAKQKTYSETKTRLISKSIQITSWGTIIPDSESIFPLVNAMDSWPKTPKGEMPLLFKLILLDDPKSLAAAMRLGPSKTEKYEDQNALEYALSHHVSPKTLDALITRTSFFEWGFDLSTPDQEGNPPAHRILEHPMLLKILLKHGVSLTQTNRSGISLLNRIIAEKHDACLLASPNFSINTLLPNNYRLLDLLILQHMNTKDNRSVIKAIHKCLEKGANPNLCCPGNNLTTLDLVKQCKENVDESIYHAIRHKSELNKSGYTC